MSLVRWLLAQWRARIASQRIDLYKGIYAIQGLPWLAKICELS
jgi:hypothetical protein